MEFYASLVTALAIGFFGGAHCIFMCGGVVGALGFSSEKGSRSRQLVITLAYNLGRICSYTIMGAALGFMTMALTNQDAMPHVVSVARIVAGLLLIAMGLYLANWWQGIVMLEKLGQYLWQYLQPLTKQFLPITSLRAAFIVGLVWGWLPCGLVYSALTYSATRLSGFESASLMLAFGVGTFPAMLASGVAAQYLRNYLARRSVRAAVAVPILMFGVWTLWAALHRLH